MSYLCSYQRALSVLSKCEKHYIGSLFLIYSMQIQFPTFRILFYINILFYLCQNMYPLNYSNLILKLCIFKLKKSANANKIQNPVTHLSQRRGQSHRLKNYLNSSWLDYILLEVQEERGVICSWGFCYIEILSCSEKINKHYA